MLYSSNTGTAVFSHEITVPRCNIFKYANHHSYATSESQDNLFNIGSLTSYYVVLKLEMKIMKKKKYHRMGMGGNILTNHLHYGEEKRS